MVLRAWIIAASVAAGAGLPAAARQDDVGPIVSLSTDSCTLRRARAVALATVIRDYARLRGHCVAVRGWNRGRSIYRSLDEALAGVAPAVGPPTRLGLYGDESAIASFAVEPRQVVAAGIVGACEVINQGEGSGGYCHYVIEGGFLILGELRPQT
jgi:hypothetical protein